MQRVRITAPRVTMAARRKGKYFSGAESRSIARWGTAGPCRLYTFDPLLSYVTPRSKGIESPGPGKVKCSRKSTVKRSARIRCIENSPAISSPGNPLFPDSPVRRNERPRVSRSTTITGDNGRVVFEPLEFVPGRKRSESVSLVYGCYRECRDHGVSCICHARVLTDFSGIVPAWAESANTASLVAECLTNLFGRFSTLRIP